MQAKLYAANYAQRREETFIRATGQCENILNGERRPVRAGDWRVTRSKQLQFEQLIIHHVNSDQENPDAVMIATCWTCHMRLHRKPGPGRTTTSTRKQGYEVIRIPYLMDLLARAGFHTWSTANGRIGWQIGELESLANDHVDALTMALHWLTGEIRDLQSKLDHLQENLTMPVHTSTPTQQERDQAGGAIPREFSKSRGKERMAMIEQQYVAEILRTYGGSDDPVSKLTLGALGLAGETGEVVDIVTKRLSQTNWEMFVVLYTHLSHHGLFHRGGHDLQRGEASQAISAWIRGRTERSSTRGVTRSRGIRREGAI